MRLGRWRLLRVVGRGGMGYVYEGADEAGQRAAVKVLDRILLAEAEHVERFHREAKLLGRLDHPNLLTVHEAGEADGVPFLVTELVLGPEGLPMTFDWVLAEDRVGLAAKLDLFEQALEALGHVHRRGILHRDFKPSNVLIERPGSTGRMRARLIDFGIALPIGAGEDDPEDSADARTIAGTLRYMAPEVHGRHPVADVRSDVYSAGVFLHEILTGEAPGEGDAPIPLAYRSVVARSIAPLPEERYPDVAAFATGLALARLEPALDLHPESRRCLAVLHRARGLELELDGDTSAAVRHYRLGQRLQVRRPVSARRLVWTGLAAAVVGLAVGLGVLEIEAQESVWRSRGLHGAAVRHLGHGERAAAERRLAASAEPESQAILVRLAAEKKGETEAVDQMMSRIEVALRGAQYEAALDLIAESAAGGGPEGYDHVRLVDATGRAYLEDTVRKASALLVAGDRAGARQILVEASRVAMGTEESPAPGGRVPARE